MTPETINLDTLTHEEAVKILQGMQASVAFLFDALDTDGNGRLSPNEIDAAPDILRTLDKDGDGELNETELEGYGLHFIPGRVRFNAIVRVLDLDGDLRVTAADIADAPNRIRRLDKDGDGIVMREDVITKPNPTVAQRVGGPVNLVKQMMNLAYYSQEQMGNLLPGSDPRGMSDGVTLHYQANNNNDVQVAKDAFLLGADGHPVHIWRSPNPLGVPEATSADLQPNGLLMRTVAADDIVKIHDWFPVGAHGTIQLVDWDGTVVWQYTHYARSKYCLHHDSRMMPNGNILVICYEALTRNEAIALGWEPQEFLNPHRGDGYVWSDRILELEPNLEDGSTKIVWEWAAIDHLVQAYDPTKPNYGKVSENRHKLNFNYCKYENYLFTFGQLYHCNSVSYSAERDQIIVSSANFSELWVIDHSGTTEETRGAKGDLLFRYGNPETYGDDAPTYQHADKKLFWQHDVQWLDDSKPHTGDILVINNGAMRGADGLPNPDETRMGFGTAYTEVLELILPTNDDGYDWDGEVEKAWSYKADPPQSMFAPFMSGCDRTPSGNTIISLGHNKRFIEVTSAGEVVADFRFPGPGNLFRVRRYGFDYPGLAELKN
ncbi:MAG: aryl-sulfate sulfotransferase [Chloroflexota bacterium]